MPIIFSKIVDFETPHICTALYACHLSHLSVSNYDTGEKLFTGVNDTSDKFFGGVNDTGEYRVLPKCQYTVACQHLKMKNKQKFNL